MRHPRSPLIFQVHLVVKDLSKKFQMQQELFISVGGNRFHTSAKTRKKNKMVHLHFVSAARKLKLRARIRLSEIKITSAFSFRWAPFGNFAVVEPGGVRRGARHFLLRGYEVLMGEVVERIKRLYVCFATSPEWTQG